MVQPLREPNQPSREGLLGINDYLAFLDLRALMFANLFTRMFGDYVNGVVVFPKHFKCSIYRTIEMPYMEPVVFVNTGRYLGFNGRDFRYWTPDRVEEAKGLGGKCATTGEVEWRDESNMVYWLPRPEWASGAPPAQTFCVALMSPKIVGIDRSYKGECMGVLTVQSTEPDVLSEKDVEYVERFLPELVDTLVEYNKAVGPRLLSEAFYKVDDGYFLTGDARDFYIGGEYNPGAGGVLSEPFKLIPDQIQSLARQLEPEELVDVIVNRIFADAERGDEVKVQLLSRISESGNGRVDPNRVASAFESIIAEQEAGYEGDPHKAPVRAQRLWKVFKGRENETIYLEDFVPVFHGTENPRKNAVNAITWIRPFLQEKSFDIVRKRLHKSATYRLVPFVSERVD